MPRSSLTEAGRAAAKAVLAAKTRDVYIRHAHEEGHSIREIAKATMLSSSRIHQILHGR